MYNFQVDGKLTPLKLFIYFKQAAMQLSIGNFLPVYMETILSSEYEFNSAKVEQIKLQVFGEPDKNEFYIKWLYDQYRKKYGVKEQENKPIVKEVKKGFNYYYHQGFISFGKTEIVGNENPYFIGGYNAAKDMYLHRNK